jgi:hypothetical protein
MENVVLFLGRRKAIVAPLATRLVAFAIAGAAVAVEIAFLELDSPDQTGFRLPDGLDLMLTCDSAYILEFHSHFPWNFTLSSSRQ